MSLLLAVAAGGLIGVSLGALGGGGSILAVPVLVYLLGQDAAQATTGSLVVVGTTALVGAVTARRAGHVMLGRGVTFGLVALGGAALGATASARVAEAVLLAAFAVLMLVVGGLMAVRQVRHRRRSRRTRHPGERPGEQPPAPTWDDPIVSFADGFACDCPRAVKVLVTATAVGLLTGFLGVGGGFLVVPALVIALGVPMASAAGTSLVVIALTSATALAVRSTHAGVSPDWAVVAALTAASTVGAVAGARLAARTDTSVLSAAFTLLVLGVAGLMAAQAVPALL